MSLASKPVSSTSSPSSSSSSAGFLGLLLSGELLRSGGLSLGVQVLNLGLTEDDPGVAVGALVDIGLADDKQDVLRPPEGDTSDALNVLEAELGDSLACLLLVARV